MSEPSKTPRTDEEADRLRLSVAAFQAMTEHARSLELALTAAEAALAEARAECERLRADAGRYRWLRDASFENGRIPDTTWWERVLGDALGDDFDAAIDAAMRGGERCETLSYTHY